YRSSSALSIVLNIPARAPASMRTALERDGGWRHWTARSQQIVEGQIFHPRHELRRVHHERRSLSFDESFARESSEDQRYRLAGGAHQLTEQSVAGCVQDDAPVFARKALERRHSAQCHDEPLFHAHGRELTQLLQQRRAFREDLRDEGRRMLRLFPE